MREQEMKETKAQQERKNTNKAEQDLKRGD